MKIKQLLFIAFILFFLNSTMIQADQIENNHNETNTWIVDINGQGDFISIQSAINNANQEDTIIIRDGLYHESIIIDKTLTIQGESKDKTILAGIGVKDVIQITAEHVSISNLFIKNSGGSGRDAGIETNADYTTISNTIISNTTIGIFSYFSNHHIITNNTLTDNKDYGIHLYESKRNIVMKNTISNNRWGIFLVYGESNTISENIIIDNKNHGIWFLRGSIYNEISKNLILNNGNMGIRFRLFCFNNSIIDNTISSNKIGLSIGLHWPCDSSYIYHNQIIDNEEYGLFISDSADNTIASNNFQNNKIHASFNDCEQQTWNQNYWETSKNPFYLIKGKKNQLPWINIDFNPSTNPIEIPTIKNDIIQSTPPTMTIQETTTIDTPLSFTWTNINGKDYTSPVKNQMPAPTCETYALCSALETLIHFQLDNNFGCDLSETHLFYYTGGTAEWGVDAVEPAEYLIDYGVPDEGCFPDPHRPYDYPYESVDGWEDRTVKITEWGWIDNDVESIKQGLIKYGPLTICQMTRKDLDLYKNGVYMPKISSPIRRGHVTTIFGYDDTNNCFIVRNSGGVEWGEEGYFRISYEGFNELYSFIFPFYGGTGILYIDGVYGNLKPEVPKVYIQEPKLYHTYLFGKEIKTIFKNNQNIQNSVPRILGRYQLLIQTDDTENIEIYIDGNLIDEYICTTPYYANTYTISQGHHTIEVIAYADMMISKDIIDVYSLI